MVAAAMLKNRKIAIFLPRFDWFRWNLARWHSSTLVSGIKNFKNIKTQGLMVLIMPVTVTLHSHSFQPFVRNIPLATVIDVVLLSTSPHRLHMCVCAVFWIMSKRRYFRPQKVLTTPKFRDMVVNKRPVIMDIRPILNGGRNASYQHPLEKACSAIERRAQVLYESCMCQHVRMYPC